MSKSLKRRVGALESAHESGRIFYCLKLKTFDSVNYWILSRGEMEPKHEGAVGPFKSLETAFEWSINDVKANHSQAFARMLKKGPINYSGRGLVVDTLPEFILEMLRTDVDLDRLPMDERVMRQAYLDDAEELKALYQKLCC
jgi:hypothetical protein